MKLYNIFIKQDSAGRVEDVVLLKDGISILALIFTPFWFLYHKMWNEFFAVIFITIIFSLFAEISSDVTEALLQSILLLLIAVNSNYWLGEHLRKKRNYIFSGVVFAKTAAEAKLNFIRNFGMSFDDLNSKMVA
jgi:hypothetical protein